jgi:glutathione synthase/RimK-type ligase-like ATP-grasp enzyme
MKKRKSLIVTSKDDSHADHVIAKINDVGNGELVIRLNTEDFINNCKVSFDGKDFRLLIKDSQRELHSPEIRSVWYRRPVDIDLTEERDEYVRAFIQKQASAFLRGLYFTCHDEVKWISPLPALHRSRLKMQQLQLAHRVGLNIPRTLITNEPAEVLRFFESNSKVCTKSLDEPNFILDGHIYPLLTRVIENPEEVYSHQASIARCPVLFQEFIEKQFDIRVIIFGEKIFAFEIHSQAHPLSVNDSRGVAPHLLKHCRHDLPAKIRSQILSFVKQQGLAFSAMDLVYSKDNQYIFLENNPNGQWLWLEIETGVNLSTHLIEMLL